MPQGEMLRTRRSKEVRCIGAVKEKSKREGQCKEERCHRTMSSHTEVGEDDVAGGADEWVIPKPHRRLGVKDRGENST